MTSMSHAPISAKVASRPNPKRAGNGSDAAPPGSFGSARSDAGADGGGGTLSASRLPSPEHESVLVASTTTASPTANRRLDAKSAPSSLLMRMKDRRRHGRHAARAR